MQTEFDEATGQLTGFRGRFTQFAVVRMRVVNNAKGSEKPKKTPLPPEDRVYQITVYRYDDATDHSLQTAASVPFQVVYPNDPRSYEPDPIVWQSAWSPALWPGTATLDNRQEGR